MILGSLLVSALAACTAEVPTVDQQTPVNGVYPPVNGGYPATTYPPAGYPGVYPAGYCRLDTRTVVEAQGRFIEVVTSHGQLFEFENGVPIQPATANILPVPVAPVVVTPAPGVPGPGVAGPVVTTPVVATPGLGSDLQSVPLYAAGPCLGAPAGMCHFETHAFVLLPEGGGRLLEYVTFAGHQWVYEAGAMTGAGVDLAAIPRYAAICALRGLSGGLCRFDTRAFYKDDVDVVESITAYGKRWTLDIDGVPDPDSGIDLTQIPQYANGPCRGRLPGQCMFETRTFEMWNGVLTESITAQGAMWRYAITGQEMPGNGAPVQTIPYLASACR